MPAKRIFISRPLPGNAAEMLREKGFEVDVNKENKALEKSEFIEILKKGNYDGVLTLLHDQIDSEVFEAVPSVKIFANYAVGYNNVDIEEAKKHGVCITNTPSDLVNESVAEHTFALLLALTCRIVEGDNYVRKGMYTGWDPNLLVGTDLTGKTLGVIGAGRIGCYVLEKAVKGFGMKAVYFDIARNEKAESEYGVKFLESVDEVLKVSDFVTLHVLLNESTRHLINKERLATMKPTSYIINTSRGPVIDELALYEALKNGKLKGAALDVYEDEPNVTEGLFDLSNVVLTPHIASSTEATREEMTQIAVDNIVDFFSGKKPKFDVCVD